MAKDLVHLQHFLGQRLEERCGREIDFIVNRFWAARRSAIPMSHTEQRLLLRAAHTMADKYAGTANFQSFLELVSNEAYEMLQHPPQVKPEETALFLSQSWSRPIEGGPAKELQNLGDGNLDLNARKYALDNLISLANSHFLDGQFLDDALPVFFDILEVLPDVLIMFSKLLESEESIIQKKSFAARIAVEIVDMLDGGTCSPTRTSNLLSILVHFYVFTVSNRFRQKLGLILVNSLSPSYHSKIARQLASHGVCALGLLVQCTNAELKEIHAITVANSRQPLVKLDKFMEKRAGRRS
ncbi:unnamed protein product, partial [Mesorhabditis spiculigera]